MAGKGQAPAEQRQRARDNKRTTITWDGTSFWGEPLPENVPFAQKGDPDGVLKWHPMTVQWWDAWRRWPKLENAHPVMWNFLLATALMVNQMWNNGRWDFAGEIRLREGKFGATPADLRSLGYDYELEGTDVDEDGEPKKPGTVTDLGSRRARLVDVSDPDKKPVKKTAAKKRAPAKKAVAKKATPAKKTAARPAAKKTSAAEPAPPY